MFSFLGDSPLSTSDRSRIVFSVAGPHRVGHQPDRRVPRARVQRAGGLQLQGSHDRHAPGQTGPENFRHERSYGLKVVS